MKHPCYNYYRVFQALGTQERAHCELFLGLLRRKLLLGKKSTQKVIIMSQTDGHQKGQIQDLVIAILISIGFTPLLYILKLLNH